VAVTIPKRKEFERRLEKVESLIRELDALEDEAAKRSAVDAVQALLDLHGETLDRLLELVAAKGEFGEATIREIAADEMVGGLLILHGLHPLTLEERIQGALAKVRPYLGSHGGNVELLGIRDGVANLRLEGSCHGCPSSTMTLKYAIEKEIAQAAPDLVEIKVEGVVEQPAAPAGFVPLAAIKPLPRPSAGGEAWQSVEGLQTLLSDEIRIEEVGGQRVLFCRLGDAHYAYRDGCAACARSLRDARLEGDLLECAGCGRRYDLRRAGRSAGPPALTLSPIPLLEDAGRVKVAAAAIGG
jgi:Fe-S cluster biogenesis protein NfuA/nitrite reductase/ring-hydroxylating ferredoxin subunit